MHDEVRIAQKSGFFELEFFSACIRGEPKLLYYKLIKLGFLCCVVYLKPGFCVVLCT
jgi:hypothetical protein